MTTVHPAPGIVTRAAQASRRAATGAAIWLGLATDQGQTARAATDQPRRPSPVREWARRTGRQLTVRTLANIVVRPLPWAGGTAAVTGILALAGATPWGVVSTAIMPLLAIPTESILTRSGQRSSRILMDVSSRIKGLRLLRKIRRSWIPLMAEYGLTRTRTGRKGQPVTSAPRLVRPRLTPYSVRAGVNLRHLGLPVGKLATWQGHLESALGVRVDIVETGPGRAKVEFRHSDPLARVVTVDDLPPPRRRNTVVTRVTESGDGLEQDIILPELIIGAQGSGKSSDIWSRLYALLEADIPFRLRVFDPKGGMELGELRDAAWVYESRATGWPDFLARSIAAMESRQRSLAKRGWRKLTRFTLADPLDLMIIDELLAVLSQRNQQVKVGSGSMKAGDAFDLYLSQGRAAGYTAVALTQLGQKELIGHARGLFPHLTVMRVPPSEKEIVDRLLGSADRHPAHLIPPGPRHAGIGFSRTESGLIVRTRGAWLDDGQRQDIADRILARKQQLKQRKEGQR